MKVEISKYDREFFIIKNFMRDDWLVLRDAILAEDKAEGGICYVAHFSSPGDGRVGEAIITDQVIHPLDIIIAHVLVEDVDDELRPYNREFLYILWRYWEHDLYPHLFLTEGQRVGEAWREYKHQEHLFPILKAIRHAWNNRECQEIGPEGPPPLY